MGKKKNLICPHCGKPAVLMESYEWYKGHDYGHKVWGCRECNTSVSCHKGSDVPMGYLGTPEDKIERHKTHAVFDVLFTDKYPMFKERGDAYVWLSDVMNVPPEEAHIGMFNSDQCREARKLIYKAIENQWQPWKK